jgi:hypothetical protein
VNLSLKLSCLFVVIRVSSLLQGTERVFPAPSCHHSLSPSTPSSSTLRSSSSKTCYSRPTSQTSSCSTLSSASSYSCLPPAPRGLNRRTSLKRVASFGVQAVRQCAASEDEEESARTQSAKKVRRSGVPGTPERRPRPMNVKRNPSILGGELPSVQSPTNHPCTPTISRRIRTTSQTTRLANPNPHLRVQTSPDVVPHRPLRRAARRISFNIHSINDLMDDSADGAGTLGSAFELH